MSHTAAHLLLSLAVLGCWERHRCEEVGEQLDRRAAELAVSEVAMVEVAPFEWDRVFLFAEYTAAESIRRSSGFDYKGSVLDPSPHVPELVNLIVFVDQGTPVCYETIRVPGREEKGWVFSPSAFDGSGLDRREAVFRVERAERLTTLHVVR